MVTRPQLTMKRVISLAPASAPAFQRQMVLPAIQHEADRWRERTYGSQIEVSTRREAVRTRYEQELTARFQQQAAGAETELLDRRSARSEEHTSELQSRGHLVCRLLLEKKKSFLSS